MFKHYIYKEQKREREGGEGEGEAPLSRGHLVGNMNDVIYRFC